MSGGAETNRDRVRRLLFAPLGFRHPKRLTEADGRAVLDRIADELAYMADDRLEALARMLAVQGEGAARCFWPARATFIAFAHVCQPRPLEDDPKLLSWFASIEGRRMVQEGTLVETWRWFERHRIPPYTPQARAMVAAEGAEAARRLQVIAERTALGYGVAEADRAWAASYTALHQRLCALMAGVNACPGGAA